MTEREKAAEEWSRPETGSKFGELQIVDRKNSFLAGCEYEAKKAAVLIATLRSISSHYGQRPDDRELARVYEDMAWETLQAYKGESDG